MFKRSLQASAAGIKQAKKAFNYKGWTQENLAEEVNLKTRQPIWRFFTGRPIERYNFREICSILDLDWREIAVDPPEEFSDRELSAINVDVLVKRVRSQRHAKIKVQCGTLKLLDTNHPVDLENIYVDVNILPDIASQQWLDIANLENPTTEEFYRFGLGQISQSQISGMDAVKTHSKLRLLGKPGCGKSTFLRHLAVECDRGNFAANLVPIMITLRDFADESKDISSFSLLNYIHSELIVDGVELSELKILLRNSRVLLLLDGLDEVSQQDNNAVLKEIRRFSEKYSQNLFVVTCRTAAKTLDLKGFTDVEIAPFTQSQIVAFAQKWFAVFSKQNNLNDLDPAVEFIAQLDLPENLSFRRLVVTPLFLHLACWVFHRQEKFPRKKAEFYKQCLDLLLGKWDKIRGIKRDEVYRGFLLPQKLKLMSQIAAATFEQGDYFFEQKTAEQQICDFISNLPNAPIEPEELVYDSEVVLKAIELQHGLLTERVRGIFSFSSLTFQEYFTARNIVASHNLKSLERDLERLVSHITEPRWRQIFLLTAAMLRSADSLVNLMKQEIDALVAEEPYLQEFLTWTNQKSLLVPQPTLAATRAFYLDLTETFYLAPHFALAYTLNPGIFLDTLLDNLVLECAIESSSDFVHAHACGDALDNALTIVLDVALQQSLQQLRDKLPDPDGDRQVFQSWYQVNHSAWNERLKSAITQHRHIQSDWHFSPVQQQILQRYYDANKLLLDCLNSNCEVTAAVRQDIEASLLLPLKELENKEWDK